MCRGLEERETRDLGTAGSSLCKVTSVRNTLDKTSGSGQAWEEPRNSKN